MLFSNSDMVIPAMVISQWNMIEICSCPIPHIPIAVCRNSNYCCDVTSSPKKKVALQSDLFLSYIIFLLYHNFLGSELSVALNTKDINSFSYTGKINNFIKYS